MINRSKNHSYWCTCFLLGTLQLSVDSSALYTDLCGSGITCDW